MQDLRSEAGNTQAPVFGPARDPARPGGRRYAPLADLIEAEILPRLVTAHARLTVARDVLPADRLEALVQRLVAPDPAAARRYFEELAAEGGSELQLMLDVLAPAARRLGVLWETDDCDFLHVTEGVERLRGIMAGLMRLRPRTPRSAPTLLMMTAPGETHAFGADMAAELFRRTGWRVERAGAEGGSRLGQRPYDAVGVSCASEKALQGLSGFVASIRAAMRPKRPPILLGGSIISRFPRVFCEMGADFACPDPDAAMRTSRALLERLRM